MRVVPAAGAKAATYDDQREVVEGAMDSDGLGPAYIAPMTEPGDAESPTRFTVTLPDDSSRDYFVNPYELQVLGSVNPDHTVSGVAVRLHGELMTGRGRRCGDRARRVLGDRDGADRVASIPSTSTRSCCRTPRREPAQ